MIANASWYCVLVFREFSTGSFSFAKLVAETRNEIIYNTVTHNLNKTSKLLLGIISIGLILSAVNLISQIVWNMNYKGYLFERLVYWATLIAVFLYAVRKPLKEHRKVFFISFLFFLFIQCSQMFSTGKMFTNEQLSLNEKFSIKNGSSLITVPAKSIYENHGLFEKEVTRRYVHLGQGEHEFMSFDRIDSIKLLHSNDSLFNIRFYLKNKFTDQIIKRKTTGNNLYN